MKIAIDLEGTLIAECGEFLTERTSYAAQRILPCGIRAKARTLLRELAQAGHRLSVYSLNKMPPWKLWLWCRLCGLPVRSVITINRRDFMRLHRTFAVHPGIIVCTENRDYAEFANRIDQAIRQSAELTNQLVRVVRGNPIRE